MKQTLLSLLALLIATLLSFNQQQASIRSQQQTVRAEMEMMALGVAMQTMEVVRAQDFDAAVDNNSKSEILSDLEGKLADDSNFGAYEDCRPVLENKNSSSDCDTVDDFHTCDDVESCKNGFSGVDTYTVQYPLQDGEFLFQVALTVRYVNDMLNYDGGVGKTEQKEVIVWVQDKNGQLPSPIRYSEVITFP